MSAELNVQVKLNLLESEVRKVTDKLQASVGGAMGKAASSDGGSSSSASSKYGLAKFAQLYVNFKLIQTAFASLKATTDGLIGSFEDAKKVYAKAGTGGLGIAGTTKIGILSSIIGVSEKDVYRFGGAIQYLNPQIEKASKILSETNSPLTQISWQWGVMKTNLAALFAKITSDAAPSILKFVDHLNVLVQAFQDSLPILEKVYNIAKWSNPLYVFHRATEALANKIYGVSQAEIDKGRALSSMPSAVTGMKQLPASTWERMGLVIGGTGGTNYAAKTANNTEEIKKSMGKLVMAVLHPKQSGTNPFGQAIASTP